MEFIAELYLLSKKFIQDYPPADYPEIMYKNGHPYTCLLIDTHIDFLICVPFRSDIKHSNAFLFSGTARSLLPSPVYRYKCSGSWATASESTRTQAYTAATCMEERSVTSLLDVDWP